MGVIEENDLEGFVEVAEPVGVVAGVTPVTNPTSTTMFKSLICAKTRNPIIFAFHPSAQKCSAEAARILKEAAVKNGAPEHCIQWIEVPSMEATTGLMKHEGVSLILLPAVPEWSSRHTAAASLPWASVRQCTLLYQQKCQCGRAYRFNDFQTFDNGMICASEQAVIVDEAIRDEFSL